MFLVGFHVAVIQGRALKPRSRSYNLWTDESKEAFNEDFREILNLDRGYPSEFKYIVIPS